MSESHYNVLDVLKYAQMYYQKNRHGFTAPDLHRYMQDWEEISEPTVRECLKSARDRGWIEQTEVSKTEFYAPDEAMLPQPEESDMYSDADLFWR